MRLRFSTAFKQGDSYSDVMIRFGSKFKLSVDLIGYLKL